MTNDPFVGGLMILTMVDNGCRACGVDDVEAKE